MASLSTCASLQQKGEFLHDNIAKKFSSQRGIFDFGRKNAKISRSHIVRADGENEAKEPEVEQTARAFRRQLMKSDIYNRKGFGYKKEMLQRLEDEYTSKAGLFKAFAIQIQVWN